MDLQKELTILQNRVAFIENRLGLSITASKPASSSPSTPATEPSAPAALQSKEQQFSSAKLLGVISVICFILACAFVIKLAIDAGWLTPVRQIGIAALMGGLLIFTGIKLKEKDNQYASYLPAAGVIILFLSIFGAHLYFGLISDLAACVLSGLVSILSVWLFTVFRADIFAVCAAVGSYCVPLLIGFFWSDFQKLSLYFLGWSVTYSLLSIFVQSRTLSIVASYCAIGLFGLLSILHGHDAQIDAAKIQLIQFAILLFGAVGFSFIHQAPLRKAESACYYPILLFFYVTEFAFLQAVDEAQAPYIMLLIAGLVFAAYTIAKKRIAGVVSSKSLVESYCILTLFHSLYLEILPDQYRPVLFLIILAGSILTSSSKVNASDSVTGFLAITLILLREYGRVLDALITPSPSALWVGYGLIASGLFLLKGIKDRQRSSTATGTLYFVLGHSLFVAALYGLFEPVGSLELSMAWTAYACAILWYGFTQKNEPLAKSSLAVLFFAVAKVFTYDVSNASPVIRILCLLLTAVVLYGCGWLLKKIEAWEVKA